MFRVTSQVSISALAKVEIKGRENEEGAKQQKTLYEVEKKWRGTDLPGGTKKVLAPLRIAIHPGRIIMRHIQSNHVKFLSFAHIPFGYRENPALHGAT